MARQATTEQKPSVLQWSSVLHLESIKPDRPLVCKICFVFILQLELAPIEQVCSLPVRVLGRTTRASRWPARLRLAPVSRPTQ